jgi:hypothetical protein
MSALAGRPELAAHYAAFRDAAHTALDPSLVALVQQAIAAVHGTDEAPDESGLDEATRACLAYARRMPFEHTAITDAEAAAAVAALGEPGYVAFSVVAALADAECRAGMVGLPELVDL